jgi:aminopeptidase-like protein
LGNNELSGPLALLLLYEKLQRLARRRYSYKFLIIPETIGSLTFLATEGKNLLKKPRAGIVLTCLGGPKRKVSFKLSRLDWMGTPSLIDSFARDAAARDAELFEVREFSPASGSDERQFCSPGINWPVVQAAKTVYGEYKEYHTSLDNKEFMSVEAVEASAESLFVFLRLFDLCDKRIHSKIEGGEPQLGKRGLYPTTNGPMTNKFSTDKRKDGRYQLNLLLNVLSLSDGSMTAIGIVKKLGISFTDLLPILDQLSANQLIEIR